MVRDYNRHLEVILEAFAEIKRYTEKINEFDDFVTNDTTLRVVIRNIEIISDAVEEIPDDIKSGFSHIEWLEMASLRNDYDRYNGLEIIWIFIRNKLKVFEAQLKAVKPINNDGLLFNH